MPEPVAGKVVGRKQWTETLFSIQIDADILPFQAGQFGRVGLPIGEEGKPVLRPYSFVNPPHERPLEFCYVIVPGGPLSVRLPTLAAGDDILINAKANGFLVLSEVPDARQLWMLSTGTAIGPFISILKTEECWKRFDELILVHAVRYAAELAYRDEIARLCEAGGGRLRYIPFVSREKTDFALSGRIPAALANGELAQAAGVTFSPEESQFMLCGNPQMVKDTSDTLQQAGFARNRRRTPGHITVENYW